MADHRNISWRPIPTWPNYEISDQGIVRTITTGWIHRLQTSDSGHLFFYPKRGRKCYVHRAVLEAFVGPCPEGKESRHLDDIPTNNYLDNLCWGTRLENVEDKRRNDRLPVGERSGTHVLTESEVLALRDGEPGSLRELGRKHGVSHTAIRRARNGMNWGHLMGGSVGRS